MAFKWWRGGFPKFPFTNNHEANLDYFLSVFSEIWEEWEEMYNELKTWKENTDLSLEEWKNGVIDSIANWELDFQRAINEWKTETETDISDWENGVLEDLASWKQDFIDDYENIESRVNSIVSDTEDMVENLANPFSATDIYIIGDYAIYNGILYKFTANHNGVWSDSDVERVITTDEIKKLIKENDKIKYNLINDERLSGYKEVDYNIDGTGYIKYNDGSVVTSSNYSHTNFIYINNFKKLKYKKTKSTSNNAEVGVSFYSTDDEDSFISGIVCTRSAASMGYEEELYEVDVPRYASYIRCSLYTNINTYGIFEIYGITKLEKEIKLSSNLFDVEDFSYNPNDIPETAIEYHELWNKLVNTGFISRSSDYIYVDDNLNYPIYTYIMKSANRYMGENTGIVTGLPYTRKKILAISGQHGDEKESPYVLYKLIERFINNPIYREFATMYEWHIIPLVNPSGYNANTRYNYENIDINRDYNDVSGFETEEAQYVRDLLLANNFYLAFDFHQYPGHPGGTITKCGFSSMNPKRTAETEDEYNKLAYTVMTELTKINSKSDADMCYKMGIKYDAQTSYIWLDSNINQNTFKNYSSGTGGNTLHTDKGTKLTITEETSTVCGYYSNTSDEYNSESLMFTNIYINNLVLNIMKLMLRY